MTDTNSTLGKQFVDFVWGVVCRKPWGMFGEHNIHNMAGYVHQTEQSRVESGQSKELPYKSKEDLYKLVELLQYVHKKE